MEKHKVELMKKIIVRAFDGAQDEAAEVAKAKVGVAAALASVKCQPKQDKENLEKAEKAEAAAIKAQDALRKVPDKKPSAAGSDCTTMASDMAKDANSVLDEIDANLAGGGGGGGCQ